MEYEAVIGLEIHAQLKTRSKMFCSCRTDFGAPPNTQVCPVCLGHPGVLPVVNKHAVELGVRMGHAVGATIHPVSTWARKNYFYPDLPKGYQITQYEHPLSEGGSIEIEVDGTTKRIGITRMHLEEDAGKSKHPEWVGETRTFVDLNRCGVPLLEIVSEPDMRSPEEAYAFLVKLRQILRYTGVCDGDMEKGSLRCDSNISVRPKGSSEFGTKTEIKNLNSFRNVERALRFEFERQVAMLQRGERIEQATLVWDQVAGEARMMRSKEEAHDYRYFPEPDLPPLVLSEEWIEEIGRSLPELPDQLKRRLIDNYGIRPYDAEVLIAERSLCDYFERVVEGGAEPQAAANFIGSELLRVLKERRLEADRSPVPAEALAELLRLVADGTLSSKLAKQVFEEMVETGRPARAIVEEKGLVQVDDSAQLLAWVREVLDGNPKEVGAYLAGKETLLRFFMGQVMKASRGKANPKKVQELLREELEKRRG